MYERRKNAFGNKDEETKHCYREIKYFSTTLDTFKTRYWKLKAKLYFL